MAPIAGGAEVVDRGGEVVALERRVEVNGRRAELAPGEPELAEVAGELEAGGALASPFRGVATVVALACVPARVVACAAGLLVLFASGGGDVDESPTLGLEASAFHGAGLLVEGAAGAPAVLQAPCASLRQTTVAQACANAPHP